MRTPGLVLFAILAGACNKDHSVIQLPTGATPSNPGVNPTPIPAPPLQDGPSNAVLKVQTFTAQSTPSNADFLNVKLVVAETGGRSGAYILRAYLLHSNGTEERSCDRVSRVDPHGTWDMDSLGYCAPGQLSRAVVPPPVGSLTMSLVYRDDQGHEASVSATTLITH